MADERDVVGLRTNHRGEQVYLYRLKSTPALARALLLDYVDSINGLVEHPQFYNALVDNCTTSIRRHGNTSIRTRLPSIGVSWPTATWTSACTTAASSTRACPSKSSAG